MAISKIVYGNNTLLDLTSDTVVAEKLFTGYTAHSASGISVVGTYVEPVAVYNSENGNLQLYTQPGVTPLFINQLPISIDSNGDVYNQIGYKLGYRGNSNGAEVVEGTRAITGFIPAKSLQTVYCENIGFELINSYYYIHQYDSSFNHLLTTNGANAWMEFAYNTSTNKFQFRVSANATSTAYIRITFDPDYNGCDVTKAIVSVGDPIEYSQNDSSILV